MSESRKCTVDRTTGLPPDFFIDLLNPSAYRDGECGEPATFTIKMADPDRVFAYVCGEHVALYHGNHGFEVTALGVELVGERV